MCAPELLEASVPGGWEMFPVEAKRLDSVMLESWGDPVWCVGASFWLSDEVLELGTGFRGWAAAGKEIVKP